jgi:hypothetical protein
VSAFLDSLLKVVLQLKPGTLISAIAVALFLAMALALVYDKARRKVSDAKTLLVSLVLVANVVSMALAAGFLTLNDRGDRTTAADFNGIVFRGAPPGPPPSFHPGPLFFPPADHPGGPVPADPVR